MFLKFNKFEKKRINCKPDNGSIIYFSNRTIKQIERTTVIKFL